MTQDLDDLLGRLSALPGESSLAGFEAAVLSGISQRRDARRTARALAPARAAAVGLSLAIGVAAGGMAAATTLARPQGLDTFSSAAHLAPSTLLDGRR